MGLIKKGEEERREDIDLVGERGPKGFFCLGDELVGVGTFFGVGGDFGTAEEDRVRLATGEGFGEGRGIVLLGVVADFGGVRGAILCTVGCKGDGAGTGAASTTFGEGRASAWGVLSFSLVTFEVGATGGAFCEPFTFTSVEGDFV